MEQVVTAREFDTWKSVHDPKVDRILDYIEQQTEINRTVAVEIARLTLRQEECAAGASRRSAYISSVLSALIGAVAGYFSGGK